MTQVRFNPPKLELTVCTSKQNLTTVIRHVELSEAGLEEAEQLGRHWVELLQGNAASGRVRVFVSPMRRCMQTIDPLMRKLGAIGATVPATVLTAIHEQPGLLHPVRECYLIVSPTTLTFVGIVGGQAVGARHCSAACEPGQVSSASRCSTMDWQFVRLCVDLHCLQSKGGRGKGIRITASTTVCAVWELI